MSVVSPHEALVYVMVTMSAVDDSMSDRELLKIGDIVRSLPVFRDYSEERLVADAEACGEILQRTSGLDEIIGILKNSLPPALHETAYALAVEVAAADLSANQEELRFLQMLYDELELERLIVAAIERAARIRYRVLG